MLLLQREQLPQWLSLVHSTVTQRPERHFLREPQLESEVHSALELEEPLELDELLELEEPLEPPGLVSRGAVHLPRGVRSEASAAAPTSASEESGISSPLGDAPVSLGADGSSVAHTLLAHSLFDEHRAPAPAVPPPPSPPSQPTIARTITVAVIDPIDFHPRISVLRCHASASDGGECSASSLAPSEGVDARAGHV